MSSPPERSCRLPTFMGSAAKAGALEALRPANAAALPKNCLRSIFMPLLPCLTGDNRQPRCCQPEVHARGPEPLYYASFTRDARSLPRLASSALRIRQSRTGAAGLPRETSRMQAKPSPLQLRCHALTRLGRALLLTA